MSDDHIIDHPARPCPECGTPPGTLPARRPWWSRTRSSFQFASLLLAIAFLAWMQFQHWPTLPPAAAVAPLPQPAEITLSFPSPPEHRFSRADVEAIARGASPRRLTPHIDLLHDTPFPGFEFAAAFIPPEGSSSHSRRFGWPAPIVTCRWDAHLSDVYDTTTVTEPLVPRAPMWAGLRYSSQRLEPGGLRRTTTIDFIAAGAGLLILLLASAMAAPIAALLRRCASPRRWPTPGRRSVRAALLLLAIPLIAMLALRAHDSSWCYTRHTYPDSTATGLTLAKAQQLATGPAGDQAIAGAILRTAANDGTLATGAYLRSPAVGVRASGGWPSAFHDHSYSRYQWTGLTADPFTEFRLRAGRLWITTVREAPTSADLAAAPTLLMSTHVLQTRGLIFLLLLACLAWFAGALPAFIARRLQHRRQHRRLQLVKCLHCGYQLAMPRRNRRPHNPNPSI